MTATAMDWKISAVWWGLRIDWASRVPTARSPRLSSSIVISSAEKWGKRGKGGLFASKVDSEDK